MNPLQKYCRQPKIYIPLPSNGNYYPEGALVGDATNMPILAMTGVDELIMKTPDALFNGEATVKLIESCCPYIKNAKAVPTIDLNSLLAAIRLATFGDELMMTHVCKNPECKESNDYAVPVQDILSHYSGIVYDNKLIIDNLTVYFKPLDYSNLTRINIESFTLNQMLQQLAKSEDNEKTQQYLDEIYEKLALNQVEIFLESIDYIQTSEEVVTDKLYIHEWLANCDREYYQQIKSHLETLKTTWDAPQHHIQCNNCGKEDTIRLAMDQSHFFV